MSETVVTSCTSELATFSDGTSILRQRPYLNAEFGLNAITQPDFFRGVFVMGSTKEECKARLANPVDIPTGGDGRGVGR